MERLIVVGVDGSESSIDALRWAAEQARLTDSSLEVISAWELPASIGWTVPLPDDFDPEKDAREALARVVETELGDESTLEVNQSVVQGHAAAILVDASQRADLLVVGSRGRGAFAGMLLGSVSDHCVAHSNCPVVVVRHQSTETTP